MTSASRSINPLNGEEVVRQLEATGKAQESWAQLSTVARASAVDSLGIALRASRDELAKHLVNEIGKPVSQALAETAHREFRLSVDNPCRDH